MGRKAIFATAWAALSALLLWLLKETAFAFVSEEITSLVEAWTGRRVADMIGNATAVAIPLVGAAAVLSAFYAVAFRHAKTQLAPTSVATEIEWLPAPMAALMFLDEGTMGERRLATAAWMQAMFGGDGQPPKSVQEIAVALARAKDAEHATLRELRYQLSLGGLAAKGTIAPITPTSSETTIPMSWWGFLDINLAEATAAGGGVQIIGLMIGRPKTKEVELS